MIEPWQEHGPLYTPPNPAGARVFVMPRCCAGVAFGAFAATLEERNIDLGTVMIGPMDERGRAELVRRISVNGPAATYERFDGTRFEHETGQPAPAPEAA